MRRPSRRLSKKIAMSSSGPPGPAATGGPGRMPRGWAGAGAGEGFAGQVGEGGEAVDDHDQVGLGEDAAQDVDDPVGAADGEAVGVGAADGDGGDAEG